MSFWVYMLHCNGGRLYVGHTENLDVRLAQHENGLIPGFTSAHLPLKLIWSEACETRDAAKEFELRLKGWSRAKKLALVRGDWTEISRLADNRLKKEGQAFDRLRQAEEGVTISTHTPIP
jgi:predicted GIY-YIG superfamily endonuclease